MPMSFKDVDLLTKKLSDTNKRKCSNCGHTVFMTNRVKKVVCGHCGHFIFFDKKSEFEYELKKTIYKQIASRVDVHVKG